MSVSWLVRAATLRSSAMRKRGTCRLCLMCLVR